MKELKRKKIDDLVSQIGEGHSIATVNRRVACFRGFLNWAARERLIEEGVVEKLPGHNKVSSSFFALSPDQKEALITQTQRAKKKRDLALIQIALNTGAKATEIVKLRTRDIMIYPALGKMSVRFHNRTSGREIKVPLDKDTARAIDGHIREGWLMPNDPLFPGRSREKFLTRARFWQILKNYGREIGVPNLDPTVLRDTFTANFPGTPQELARILGVKHSRAISLQNRASKET